MRTGLKMAKPKRVGPGRCDCCGCLMVLVKLRDRLGHIESLPRLGWRCLICNRVVDVHSTLHRRARPRATPCTDGVRMRGVRGQPV
jgi:hypothetical protein